VSLRIITLLFVDHDDRIKAFFPQAWGQRACICCMKKRLNPGEKMKRDNLNAVVFVRDEFRRIMPAIE